MIFKASTKRFLIAAATLSASVVFAGSAHAQSAGATLTPGQLKVGMEIAYPPLESYDGDKVVGSDVDFSRALAKQIGATANFTDTKFSGLILGLNAHHFDAIISGMYITPERVAQARAIPYAQTSAAIMVAASSAIKPQKPEELCGMHVGLEQGTTWVGKLQALSKDYCKPQGKADITVSEYPSAPEALQALLSNNVQAQIEQAGAAHALAAKSSGRVVVVQSPVLIYPQTIGIFVRKDNTTLYDKLSEAFDTLKRNGEYEAMLNKYNLSAAPAQAP
jgi:polar amino acid transport system substrate-binding protein